MSSSWKSGVGSINTLHIDGCVRNALLVISLFVSSVVYSSQQGVPIQQFGLGEPGGVCFSGDDGQILVAGTNAQLLNAESGEIELQYLRHAGWVRSAEISSDNSMVLTAGTDHSVMLWDKASGHLLRTIRSGISTSKKQKYYTIRYAALSSDCQSIITSDYDDTLRVWSVKTGDELLVIEDLVNGISNSVEFLVFPDSSKILTIGDVTRSVSVWDLSTGQNIKTIPIDGDRFFSVDISPDGENFVTGHLDGSLRFWDLSSGSLIKTVVNLTGGISNAEYSPDGGYVAVSGWNVTGYNMPCISIVPAGSGGVLDLKGVSSTVKGLAYSSDGTQLVAVHADRSVRFWNTTTGVNNKTWKYPDRSIAVVALSPDRSRVIAADEDEKYYIWDVENKRLLYTKNSSANITSIDFSPDGQFAAMGCENNRAYLLDVFTGNTIRSFIGHLDDVSSVAFSSDGSKLVTGSLDGTAMIFDVGTGDLKSTCTGHTDDILSVDFSPDGETVFTASNDSTVKQWDVASETVLHTFEHPSGVSSITVSSTGSYLLSAAMDARVRIWDIESRDLYLTVLKPDSSYATTHSTAFSHDESIILSGDISEALLWGVKDQLTLEYRFSEFSMIESAAMSSDASLVVTGSSDGVINVWDAGGVKPVNGLLFK